MSKNGSAKRSVTIDPASKKLGSIYAEALLGATEKAGTTEAVLGEFDSLIADVLDANPRLEQLLASAIVPADDKERILERTLGNQASPMLLNFLKTVAKHLRFDGIRAIHQAAHELLNQLRGRVRVEVVTAAPIDGGMQQQLSERIRAMLGREPVLENRVDPDLIGGLVLRVGDTVYDGSVATQLQRLSAQIISRSVHEIQSRRDRFSYPSGN